VNNQGCRAIIKMTLLCLQLLFVLTH